MDAEVPGGGQPIPPVAFQGSEDYLPFGRFECRRWLGRQSAGFRGRLQLIGQVAMAHLAAKGRFSAAFQFGEMWTIFKANAGGFILAWLIVYAATMAIVFVSQFLMVTVVLCLIYPLVIAAGSVYLAVVSYALYAQAYVDAVENREGSG